MKLDPDAPDTSVIAQALRFDRIPKLRPYVVAQELGRGDLAVEFRLVVEIAVFQRLQRRVQGFGRKADVDHQAIRVQVLCIERCVDDEGRAVQALGRAEDGDGKECAIMM